METLKSKRFVIRKSLIGSGVLVEFQNKKGDTITWEYKGTVKSGTIKKLNHKTCEVLGAGGSPFGSTTYKIYKSMITGVV